jgi:hypothetical protein
MATDLVTYLSFDGRCEAAFKHDEKILGGKILMMPLRRCAGRCGRSAKA